MSKRKERGCSWGLLPLLTVRKRDIIDQTEKKDWSGHKVSAYFRILWWHHRVLLKLFGCVFSVTFPMFGDLFGSFRGFLVSRKHERNPWANLFVRVVCCYGNAGVCLPLQRDTAALTEFNIYLAHFVLSSLTFVENQTSQVHYCPWFVLFCCALRYLLFGDFCVLETLR